MLLTCAACGYFGWRYLANRAADAAVEQQSSTRPAAGPAPIPVTIASVVSADFPVYLTGLGTVQPYTTVTVRSRVDGEVIKVGFKQGQMVKEGDLLVQIDPRPYQAALEQAQAKKAQDEATLKDAQLNLQRYNSLARQDFASRQQLDTQQATVDQLTAQIKGDQAVIDNAQTQVGYTTIRSPLTGKTGFRLVDPGNIVHASDTTGIVSIVKLQPISVVFTAPEEQVPDINKALADGAVPVTAMSSDGTKTLSQGRLALVDNAVDQASGTIRMKATFENKDNVLWPGLSVRTRLLIDTVKQAVIVPNDAIERGPDGLYAFVVDDTNKVSVRAIKVGDQGANRSVILDGLSPGDKVVVAGQYRLQAGVLVQARDGQVAGAPIQEAQSTVQNAPVKVP
ncbi:membrane fusion protein, multidrug efflux system [Rhizobiales bacterium GAS113]|nr:membrane fusion protein, multidrug efflux system [Rhizobiales bacterium GAS113]